jgi:hypothetical protein
VEHERAQRRAETPRRPTTTPPYTHADAGLGPPVRVLWDPPGAAPPSFPTPLAPRAARAMARPSRPCRRSSTGVPVVHHRTSAPYHAPMPRLRRLIGVCEPPSNTHLYKGQKLVGHARCAVAQSRATPPWPSTPSPVPACVPSSPAFQAPPPGPAVAPQAACCSGRAATRRSNLLQWPPPRPAASPVSAVSKHLNRCPTTPRPHPKSPPASLAAVLAGFWRTAPPPCP